MIVSLSWGFIVVVVRSVLLDRVLVGRDDLCQ
ncbi:hypothetical protein BJB45_05260 [Halomonas huangheensis]|uniref:Uncharacterized protein n=1 Tax=Halomonas huangheensis TaxID=1178482 RepID=W1N4N8_9GAMM|nr:hypothetical protein BJB45_05260 [Halomonas huangheensis]